MTRATPTSLAEQIGKRTSYASFMNTKIANRAQSPSTPLSLGHIATRLLVVAVLMVASSRALVAQQVTDSLTQEQSLYLRQIDSSFLALSAQDLPRAEAHFRHAMRILPQHPLNAYLLNNIGGIQQMQGRIDEAILSYSAALERMPDEQITRFNRARLYALQGKHQAASTDYSILVAQSPRSELYLYQRAMSYMLEGKYDMADLDLRAIIDANDKSLKARLGYALLETMRGNYDEAERLYDYLVSRLVNSPEVYEGRARLYLARGMRGYAERDVNKAFELSGANKSATLYRLRAELARLSGDKTSAQKDEETARSIESRLDPIKELTEH